MVQLAADAARTRLSFLTALGVEHGAAAVTPAREQGTTQDLDQDLTVPVSVGLGVRYIQDARQEFSNDVSGTSSDMFGL